MNVIRLATPVSETTTTYLTMDYLIGGLHLTWLDLRPLQLLLLTLIRLGGNMTIHGVSYYKE